MSSRFRLSLETTDATATLIGLLRRHTGRSMSDLRHLIANRQPFLDETPHHNQYSAFISGVTALLDELDVKGIRYQVEVDGFQESSEYLRNVFRQWHEIGTETAMMTDIESGTPCIDTLEWLKRERSTDAFRQTLKQIVDGDGYRCDVQTVEWARRELDAGLTDTTPE